MNFLFKFSILFSLIIPPPTLNVYADNAEYPADVFDVEIDDIIYVKVIVKGRLIILMKLLFRS